MLTDIHSHHIGLNAEEKLISCSMPGIGHDEWNKAHHVSLSLHPWYITEENLTPQLQWIEQNVQSPHVLAIGEAGLDKLCNTPFGLQLKAFRNVISLSERYHLPLVIHCVKSYNEIIGLKLKMRPKQPWVLHGFRGKKELMQMLVRHGFYLSFGERYQEQSLQLTPIEHILVETDESHIDIAQLYKQISQSRGMDSNTFTRLIQNNIRRVFSKLV